MPVTIGKWVAMDVVVSLSTRRLLGASLAALGVAACVVLAFERSSERRERRFYLIFLPINLLLDAGRALFWYAVMQQAAAARRRCRSTREETGRSLREDGCVAAEGLEKGRAVFGRRGGAGGVV